MRHDSSRKLYEYWNCLRGGRPAPERSDVEPSDIRGLLGDTFILEVSARMRTISFRLAGTRLCAAYGRELRGLGFLALWSEEDNFDVARHVSQVYSTYSPVVLAYTAQTEARNFVEYESLLLPLLPSADGNLRILGVATPRNPPYWLGSEPLTCNYLRSGRMMRGYEAAPPLAPETPAEPVPMRRVGHLTVLEGGKSRGE